MVVLIAAFSYALCAAAFFVVTVLTALSRSESRYKRALFAAGALTFAWAAATFVLYLEPDVGAAWSAATGILEHLRSLAWLLVIGFVLFFAYGKRFDRTFTVLLVAGTAGSVLFLVGAELYGLFSSVEQNSTLVRTNFIAHVVLAVCGLLVAENLFRNSGSEARWAVKTLCFGVGTIFAYDFFLFTEASLFGRVDPDLIAARGFVVTLTAPLILVAAARAKRWPIDLHMSRQLVFHSATLLVAGGYLIAISGATYYISTLDTAWGITMRVVFVTVAVLVMALVLTSGTTQARIRDFINRNFFSYKYDYRSEWLKFIDSISSSSAQVGIPDRIVRAIGNIVESTSGALWVYEEEDRAYQPAANWNMGEVLPSFSAREPLMAALAADGAVFDLTKDEIDGRPATMPAMPKWLAEHPRAWLAVGLIRGGTMVAFAVLGNSRAPRKMTWEDYTLLQTAARQAASYVAEELSARSLARARRFEDFNRQFAFVVHDIKNLAGQLSLILKNAEKHGDNPEFQKDVLATVGDSVERMHEMLEHLRAGRQANGQRSRTDLCALLAALSSHWRLRSPGVALELPGQPVWVRGDSERLSAIANHLVQNAIDASGAGKSVIVRVAEKSKPAEFALLSVTDKGPGMDRKFIEEKLFQPLDSTKSTGYGIGAFQVRQLARELGGQLSVESTPGRGTTMNVELPLAGDRETPLEPRDAAGIAETGIARA
jgi:putative PEP-CTERM system histidine kinase